MEQAKVRTTTISFVTTSRARTLSQCVAVAVEATETPETVCCCMMKAYHPAACTSQHTHLKHRLTSLMRSSIAAVYIRSTYMYMYYVLNAMILWMVVYFSQGVFECIRSSFVFIACSGFFVEEARCSRKFQHICFSVVHPKPTTIEHFVMHSTIESLCVYTTQFKISRPYSMTHEMPFLLLLLLFLLRKRKAK